MESLFSLSVAALANRILPYQARLALLAPDRFVAFSAERSLAPFSALRLSALSKISQTRSLVCSSSTQVSRPHLDTDASRQFDAATQANMIRLAKEFRQVEKNTPPVRPMGFFQA